MSQTVRWGILGPGRIAKKFALGLKDSPGAQLLAVGSRSAERAQAFGEQFSAPRRYGSYEQLVADADLDAVYVATPHPKHAEHAAMCLEAGKAVLCEKPFTVNAAQAERLIAVARRKKVFLMEAMWTRFLPSIVRLRQLLAEKVIGEVRLLTAELGFRADLNPQSRLFDPNLAGGALLDVGVYCVSFAHMAMGTPDRVAALADMGTTGVDEQAGVVLGHSGGRLSMLTAAIRTNTPHEAWVYGTEGHIHLHHPWWRGGRLTVQRDGQPAEEINLPVVGNGSNYQTDEVARCLAAGKLESDVMPLDESLAAVRTLDRIRAQWGLKYPVE